MERRFTGWPEAAFDVLLRLDGDPSEAVRRERRRDREHLVRQPMIALLNDLADIEPRYEDFAVWGYAKTAWWWQHQCGRIRFVANLEFGLQFDLDGLTVAATWWYPDSEQLGRFRAAVADETTGPVLATIVRTLDDGGAAITGDRLKRALRGYAADHPRADLLRYRSLRAELPLGCDDWLHTPEAVDRVLDGCARLRPLLSWLAEHVTRTATG